MLCVREGSNFSSIETRRDNGIQNPLIRTSLSEGVSIPIHPRIGCVMDLDRASKTSMSRPYDIESIPLVPLTLTHAAERPETIRSCQSDMTRVCHVIRLLSTLFRVCLQG